MHQIIAITCLAFITTSPESHASWEASARQSLNANSNTYSGNSTVSVNNGAKESVSKRANAWLVACPVNEFKIESPDVGE